MTHSRPTRSVTTTASAFYRPELDVLRFFAFLAVFVHHCFAKNPGPYVHWGVPETVASWLAAAVTAGSYGVDLFFVLSAYLITELLRREQLQNGRLDVWAFYARRSLRIWPLYYSFLIAATFVVPHLLPGDSLAPRYFWSFVVFGGNWACAMWDSPSSVAGPLWSVSLEEQFYLTWPLLLAVFGFTRMPVLALGLFLVANAARVFLVLTEATLSGVWCNTLARLDPIACGAVVSMALRGRCPDIRVRNRALLLSLGLVLLVLSGRWGARFGPKSLITYPAVAVGCTALLLGFLGSAMPGAVGRLLQYLGRISYGLYVFHQLAIHLLGHWGFRFPELPFAALVFTAVLAAASYRWLERPFLRLKMRLARV